MAWLEPLGFHVNFEGRLTHERVSQPPHLLIAYSQPELNKAMHHNGRHSQQAGKSPPSVRPWWIDARATHLPSMVEEDQPPSEPEGREQPPPLPLDIEELHRTCVSRGEDTYDDPATGYSVFTELVHKCVCYG